MGFPSYMGDPSMASVHRFMALDPAEVGYFISQVGAAATCLGVASSDVSIVAGALYQYFGYRCSPYTDIGIGGPQLESICEACSCPLDPKANCGLYPKGGCYREPKVAPQCKANNYEKNYGKDHGKNDEKNNEKNHEKEHSKDKSSDKN